MFFHDASGKNSTERNEVSRHVDWSDLESVVPSTSFPDSADTEEIIFSSVYSPESSPELISQVRSGLDQITSPAVDPSEDSKTSENVAKLLNEGHLEKAISTFKRLAHQAVFFDNARSLTKSIFKMCLASDPKEAIDFYIFSRETAKIDLSQDDHFLGLIDEHICRLLHKDDPSAFLLMDHFYGSDYSIDGTDQIGFFEEVFLKSLQNASSNSFALFNRFGVRLLLSEIDGFEEALHNGARSCCARGDTETLLKLKDQIATPNGIDLFEDPHTAGVITGHYMAKQASDSHRLLHAFPGIKIDFVSTQCDHIEERPTVLGGNSSQDEDLIDENPLIVSLSEPLGTSSNTDVEGALRNEERCRVNFISSLESGLYIEAVEAEAELQEYSLASATSTPGFREALSEGYYRCLIFNDFDTAKKLRKKYAKDVSLYSEIRRAYQYCKEHGFDRTARQILKVFKKEIDRA